MPPRTAPPERRSQVSAQDDKPFKVSHPLSSLSGDTALRCHPLVDALRPERQAPAHLRWVSGPSMLIVIPTQAENPVKETVATEWAGDLC